MRTYLRGRRGLIVLNGVLLAVLAAVVAAPVADGQVQPARARGEYTMVAGRTNAGGPAAVYIVDSANQEMVVLRWDQSKHSMVGLGYRNILGDGRAAPPGR
jgi:hypothetical protein